MADNTEERKVQIVVDSLQANASLKEMAAGAALMNNQLSKMAQDDPSRAKLQDDFARLTQRMTETRAGLRQVIKTEEELAAEQQKLIEQNEALAAANQQAVASGQHVSASMNQMKAAAGVLEQQLHDLSADDPGRAALLRDYQVLEQRIAAARAEAKTYIKTAQELEQEQQQLAASTEKVNQENAQVVLNGKKVTASFSEMKSAGAQLEKQLHDLAADDPGRAKLLHDYQELQKRIDGVKKEMGETAEKGFTMKDALTFAGVEVGLEAAVDIVKELGAEIVQTVQEFEALRSSINTLTGATGEELDQLTVGVSGLAKTFGKEYDEVLVASNALSKQMGLSQQEALRLIEQGFLSGADASGEFLDQVKEYAPQFKAVGLSASQAIGQISQSVTTGIFSDKGADVIKEFGLRITEQTKSTSDAMEAAFGTDFTQKLFSGINDKSITAAEALQRVAQQMDETKIPANQLQTVIADVFGGPGEDAGIDYLKSLKNVTKGVDELVDHSNVYTQRQASLLASNKELAASQNDLAKEFEGGSTILSTLTNQGMTVLYSLLTSLAVTFKELFAPVQQVWAALMDLGESMGWVSKEGGAAKTVGETLGAVIRALLFPARILVGAFLDVSKALIGWVKDSEFARGALDVMLIPMRTLFALLTDGPAYFAGFSAAAESSFGTIGRAWKKILERDFSGAGQEFRQIGTQAGDEFTRAFEAAKKKAARATATDSSGGKDQPTEEAGGDGTTQAERDKLAAAAEKEREKLRKKKESDAKAARKKADQESLDATKLWVKEEGQLLVGRNAIWSQLGDKLVSDEEARRFIEQQKLFQDADAKIAKLTGKEVDYSGQVQTIVADRDLALRELAAKHAEEEEKRRQQEIDKKIALAQAEKEEALAELDLKLASKTISEQAYQDAVHAVQQAAHERELALIKQKVGGETAEYKKANTDKLKDETDFKNKKKKLGEEQSAFDKGLSAFSKLIGQQELDFLEFAFGKKSGIYKAAQAIRKADAINQVRIGLETQISAAFETGAAISKSAPPFSIPFGVAYTAAAVTGAVVNAGMSIAKIAGFRTGGPTSGGGGSPLAAAGLQVAPNGKLLDQDGFAVAGVVHENEYVIPEWMRADPKVAQMEQWLEARRLRGYIQGGGTSEGGSQAAPTGDEFSSMSTTDALLRELVAEQRRQNEKIDTWAREFKVVNPMRDFDQDYTTYKKVNEGGIS